MHKVTDSVAMTSAFTPLSKGLQELRILTSVRHAAGVIMLWSAATMVRVRHGADVCQHTFIASAWATAQKTIVTGGREMCRWGPCKQARGAAGASRYLRPGTTVRSN